MEPTVAKFCELVLRDGIQGWPTFIPTAEKVDLLRAIALTGVDEIDVTSFVPSSSVPQFSDACEVLAAVPAGVRARVLTVNARGVERVVEAHRNAHAIDVCGIPISASEAHNQANLRRSTADHRRAIEEMVSVLLAEGIAPLIGVVTAFGCPLQGVVPREDVYDIVDWAYQLGVRSVMFGDTTGLATPSLVRQTFDFARRQWPDMLYVGHFHDNRGVGVANSLAAFEAGADMLDGSLGGIGGEPSVVEQGYVGEAGNTATEDLISMLAAMGLLPHVDVDAVLRAGELAQKVMGRPLYSRVQLARREAAAAP